jgi:hypothetical protein
MLHWTATRDAQLGFVRAGHARRLAAGIVAVLALAAGWGSVAGAAQASASAPASVTSSIARARVSGTTASVKVTCRGTTGAKCKLKLTLSVTETIKGGKVVGVSARAKKTKKVVVLATANVKLTTGANKTYKLKLNSAGKQLLSSHRKLETKLVASVASETIATQTVTFRAGL